MELAPRTTAGWTTAKTPDEISPGGARSLLFFGPDDGGLSEYARLAAGSGDKERFDARSMTTSEIISALGAGSLFGGGTTVILDNAGDAHRSKIEEILDAPFADGARLIVMAGELKAASKLRKLYKDDASLIGIPLYHMRAGEIAAFARKYFQAEGLSVSRDAGPALVDRLSGDRAQALRACEIVALHALGAGRKDILIQDVRAMLDPVDEDALTAPLDQAILGHPGEALAALHTRMGSGEAAIKLLRFFSSRVLRLQDLLNSGMTPKDAIAKAKPPIFWAERDLMTRLLSSLTSDKIGRILKIIDRTEYTIVERGTPDLPAMSSLIIEIAHHRHWKSTT